MNRKDALIIVNKKGEIILYDLVESYFIFLAYKNIKKKL